MASESSRSTSSRFSPAHGSAPRPAHTYQYGSGRAGGDAPRVPRTYRCFGCQALGEHFRQDCPVARRAPARHEAPEPQYVQPQPVAEAPSLLPLPQQQQQPVFEFSQSQQQQPPPIAYECCGATCGAGCCVQPPVAQVQQVHQQVPVPGGPPPTQLCCALCHGLLQEAVLLGCCGVAACHVCAGILVNSGTNCPVLQCGSRVRLVVTSPPLRAHTAVWVQAAAAMAAAAANAAAAAAQSAQSVRAWGGVPAADGALWQVALFGPTPLPQQPQQEQQQQQQQQREPVDFDGRARKRPRSVDDDPRRRTAAPTYR